MATFSRKFTLAFVKEVGEDDLLLSVNEEDIIVKLTENNKDPIFQAIEEGIYILPFDNENKELLMNVDEGVLKEMFPEFELEELKDVLKEIPEEHK